MSVGKLAPADWQAQQKAAWARQQCSRNVPSKGLLSQEPCRPRGQQEGHSGLFLVPTTPDRVPPLAESTAQALREALGGSQALQSGGWSLELLFFDCLRQCDLIG